MEKKEFVEMLTLGFDNALKQNEITQFRGAILSLLGNDSQLLCHNHLSDTSYRYSYPLVQYKAIDECAAIVLINEAATVLEPLLERFPADLTLGAKTETFELSCVMPARATLLPTNQFRRYSLTRWLPFNSNNYKLFLQQESIVERYQMLERIVIGNILSMAKGLGINIEEKIVVRITSISEPYTVYNKKVPLLAFDMQFLCNVDLPDNIGLGKNASIGYGIIRAIE